ncbi:DUF58 domain-containing protein [bacterium]|nr:DUF58 domain-containing protein [bacterium]
MTEPTIHFLKPRNVLVFVATVGLFIGLATGNAALLSLAAMAITALIVGFIEARQMLEHVEVRRTHLPRAFQGSSVGVELTLSTSSDRTPELIMVEDEFPPGTPSRFRHLLDRPLHRDRPMQISYLGRCDHRRGLYLLGPTRLQGADAFGLFPNELLVPSITELVVYPTTIDLREMGLLGDGVQNHVGLEMSSRVGQGEEFIGVREYRPGDAQRLIHWRSTARHGRPMVKEFQEEVTTLVSIFLDMGRLGLTGVGDQTSFEYGVRVAASIARRGTNLGHRLEFFGVGQKVEHLPPGQGELHLLTLLDRLAFLKAEGESGFAAVFRDLSAVLPRGGTTVAIMSATTVSFDELSATVDSLLARRILPIFVLIDDRGFIKLFAEQEMAHVKARSLDETARLLRVMGARVHLIRRGKDPEAAIAAALDVSTEVRAR